MRAFLISIAFVLVPLASVRADEPGETTYMAYCSLCHGIGTGTGMFADALKGGSRILTGNREGKRDVSLRLRQSNHSRWRRKWSRNDAFALVGTLLQEGRSRRNAPIKLSMTSCLISRSIKRIEIWSAVGIDFFYQTRPGPPGATDSRSSGRSVIALLRARRTRSLRLGFGPRRFRCTRWKYRV